MKKTAILIDSTMNLPEEYLKRKDIFIIPLLINFEDVSYKDVGDSDSLLREISERIEKEKKIPKTSQPSAQDIINKLEKIKEKGFERVIGLFLSSGLSGMVQGVQTAVNMFLEENDNINFQIDIFDTKLTLMPAFVILKDVLLKLDNNEDISKEKIQEIIDFYVENMKILIIVDTLDYLAYSGRINPALAAVGNLFGIKPIIKLEDGILKEYMKVRSNKKAVDLVLKNFQELNEKYEELHFGAIYVLNEKGAQKIVHYLNKISKLGKSEYPVMSFSAVIGNHTGPGTIGIFFTPKFFK